MNKNFFTYIIIVTCILDHGAMYYVVAKVRIQCSYGTIAQAR